MKNIWDERSVLKVRGIKFIFALRERGLYLNSGRDIYRTHPAEGGMESIIFYIRHVCLYE